MIVRCEKCGRVYDDENRWTICPHGPLGFPHDSYCPKCDTVIGIQGKCIHQEQSPKGQDASGQYREPETYERIDGDGRIAPDRDSI